MSLFEINAAYGRFAKRCPKTYSSFEECSEDNGYCLVTNKSKCINFDYVKNHVSPELKSCDSLYISFGLDAVFFIEFKNSPFRNCCECVPEKAHSSAQIHQAVCGLAETLDSKHIFTLVISSAKNVDQVDLTSVLLKISGYDFSMGSNDELSTYIREIYEMRYGKTGCSFEIESFQVILSDSFDNYVSHIR